MLLFELILLIEFLLAESAGGFWGWHHSDVAFSRCILLGVSDMTLPAQLAAYGIALVGAGSALIAEDTGRDRQWYFLLWGSLAGALLALIFIGWLFVSREAVPNSMANIGCGIETSGSSEADVLQEIRAIPGKFVPTLAAITIWQAGILARQLGITLPTVGGTDAGAVRDPLAAAVPPERP